jgi:hypothetical protein
MSPCDADHSGKGGHIPVHPPNLFRGIAIILRLSDLISVVVFSFGLCTSHLVCMLVRHMHGKPIPGMIEFQGWKQNAQGEET